MIVAPRTGVAVLAVLAAACGAPPSDPAASRDALAVSASAVTSSPDQDGTPALGRDAAGAFVAWTSRPRRGDGTLGPGAIWVQRLADGAPDGAPLRVSEGSTDDRMSDASEGRVVYTSWNSSSTLAGRIVVYDVATGARTAVAAASAIREARIAGGRVAWLQGPAGEATLWLRDLSDPGAGPTRIAGPSPSPADLALGDRYVAWTEATGVQRDVRAYDLATRARLAVAARSTVDERAPSTDGAWIAYEARPTSGAAVRVELLNPDTGERRVVADGGALNGAPSLRGDLLAFESAAAGSFDVLLHRVSTGETLRVTADPGDERVPDVQDDLVAWVDDPGGASDVRVARLAELPDDPCPGCGPGPSSAAEAVDRLIALVRALPPEGLDRPSLRAPLLAKLGAVRGMIDAGEGAGAYSKLLHDLLPKLDGCAAGTGPDAGDWVVDCAAQAELRAALDRALELLAPVRPAPARAPAGGGGRVIRPR